MVKMYWLFVPLGYNELSHFVEVFFLGGFFLYWELVSVAHAYYTILIDFLKFLLRILKLATRPV